MKNKYFFVVLSLLVIVSLLVACTPAAEEPATEEPATAEPAAEEPVEAEPITLTYLVGDVETDQLWAHALIDKNMELYPNVTIEIENRPGGGDGDNIFNKRMDTV